jgi:radical SAM superfamily enzyme YgiQ (UPF0313 family)
LTAYREGLDVCRKGGRICVFAPTTPEECLQISPKDLFFSETHVIPSYSTSHLETRLALELILSHKIRFEELISHRYPLEETKEAFKIAREVGLMTIASTVIGFPGETEETAWETINFIKKLNPDDIGFYVATPYPGTPMYEEVKQKGWLRITDFDKYDTATPTFETPWLSMDKIRELRYKAHQQFYLRPSYVFKMMRKGGTYGISAVKTSGAYLLRALHMKLS